MTLMGLLWLPYLIFILYYCIIYSCVSFFYFPTYHLVFVCLLVFFRSDPLTRIFPTETLWVAAKSRRVTIYCLETTEKTELTSFTTPESVTVIKALNDKVFFGE